MTLFPIQHVFFYRKRHGTEIAYCISKKILLTSTRLLTRQPDVSRIKTSHFAVPLTSWPMVLKPSAMPCKSLNPPSKSMLFLTLLWEWRGWDIGFIQNFIRTQWLISLVCKWSPETSLCLTSTSEWKSLVFFPPIRYCHSARSFT